MKDIHLNLSLPDGPIRVKYVDYVLNWWYFEQALIGAVSTAKSNAMVDSLCLSALEYPGCRLLITRANATDLKRSTVHLVTARWGGVLESVNNVEGIYRFPWVEHPVTGQMVQSELHVLGLDRYDVESVLKSREYFRVGHEEANQSPSKALDAVLSRTRQKAYHHTLKVKDEVEMKAEFWGIARDEAMIFLGYTKSDLIKPMQGINGIKAVFNPDNYDKAWARFVNKPFPRYEDGGLSPEWVARELAPTGGVVDTPVPAVTLDRRLDLEDVPVGAVAEANNKRSRFWKYQGDMVFLFNGDIVYPEEVTFIQQRRTVIVFPKENKSRNTQNVWASFLAQDQEFQERVWEGRSKSAKGLIFPNFDRKLHVRAHPTRVPTSLTAVSGIDHAPRRPTVAFTGVLTRERGELVVFWEYLMSGTSSSHNAYNIRTSQLPFERHFWGADPAMWHIEGTSMRSPAMDYIDAGIPIMQAPHGDAAADYIMDLLFVPDKLFSTSESLPMLYITENCPLLIEMFENVTWDMVHSQRTNELVDVFDAFKYLCGVVPVVKANIRALEEAKSNPDRWKPRINLPRRKKRASLGARR